ncbi:DUF2637 domain-containing protein, partial [Streptomyces sp. NPDC054841]
QARLQARFGRAWRRKAPVEALMPLRLAKYGVPLAETAPAGLAAAGIEPALLPPNPAPAAALSPTERSAAQLPPTPGPQQEWPQAHPDEQQLLPQDGHAGNHESPWFAAPQVPQEAYESAYNPTYVEGLEPTPVAVPAGPDAMPVGPGPGPGAIPGPRAEQQPAYEQAPEPEPQPEPAQEPGADTIDDIQFAELAYPVFKEYVDLHGMFPSNDQLDITLADAHGIKHTRSASLLRRLTPQFQNRYQSELEAEHIA